MARFVARESRHQEIAARRHLDEIPQPSEMIQL
jgi:hypothetical protein